MDWVLDACAKLRLVLLWPFARRRTACLLCGCKPSLAASSEALLSCSVFLGLRFLVSEGGMIQLDTEMKRFVCLPTNIIMVS